MHRDLARASIALLASALAAAGAVAADPKPLAIGAPAPDFRLPGVDGKTYGLKDFADAKVLAVAFTCKLCKAAKISRAWYASSISI